MNKELEALNTRYYESCRSFLVALQNNCSADELEVIRREIRAIVSRMEELGAVAPSSEQRPAG